MRKIKPKKVFIIKENDYVEITYEQLRTDPAQKDKVFVALHGMLLEVTKADYLEFYKAKNRQIYLSREHSRRKNISYDAFDTDEYNGVDFIVDEEYDVSEKAILNVMLERLHHILNFLDDCERKLITQHFFDEIPQTELAKIYGVNQSNISRKISKILQKLKKLMNK